MSDTCTFTADTYTRKFWTCNTSMDSPCYALLHGNIAFMTKGIMKKAFLLAERGKKHGDLKIR